VGTVARGAEEDRRTSIWFQSMASQLPEPSISGGGSSGAAREREHFGPVGLLREATPGGAVFGSREVVPCHGTSFLSFRASSSVPKLPV
jgi:hypothetical protein